MNGEQARGLLKFVNDPWVLESLQEYMKVRLQYLHHQLELAQSFEDVKRYQGAIEEIRRLTHIREEVRAKAEEK